MKRDGTVTLSYEFANATEYNGAQIYFPTNESLVLCLPTGKMLRWQWNSQQDHWESLDEEIQIVNGPFSTIGPGLDNHEVWLARGRTLFAINTRTGRVSQEVELSVGEQKGEIVADPIECVTVVKDRKLLVAALWDGRLALVPINSDDRVTR